jgi:hypothetical protein
MRKYLFTMLLITAVAGCNRPDLHDKTQTNRSAEVNKSTSASQGESDYVPTGDATWDKATAIMHDFR